MSTESGGYISFGVGLLFGLSIGAVAGILTAPKPGIETREDIKNAIVSIPEHICGQEKEKSPCCLIDKLRYAFDKQISNINEAVKAGKMASAKKREELEDGLATCC